MRHQAVGLRLTPYQLWLQSKEDFGIFQKFQARPVFSGAAMLASFVATPIDETLFVGLYAVHGVGAPPKGLADPLTGKIVGRYNTISGKEVGQHLFYDLSPMQELQGYQGKLLIEWGPGYRSWVQWAHKQNKSVSEIRRSISEPLFPGYLRFRTQLSKLTSVPASWRIALSAVSGIYLLVHPDSGKLYVGKAVGAGGFWSRWEHYVASGHGGNRRMKDIPAADYHVTILEVASMPANEDTVDEMESRWKLKLLSRTFGLNAN